MWTLIFPKQETAYAFLLSTCFVHILIYFYREVSIPPCLGVHSYPHRRNMNPFKMKQGRTCSWDHFCCWCPIFLFKLTRHTQPAFKGWIIPAFYNFWSSPISTFQNTQNNKQLFCKVFVMFWLLPFCPELTLCDTGYSCVCSFGFISSISTLLYDFHHAIGRAAPVPCLIFWHKCPCPDGTPRCSILDIG